MIKLNFFIFIFIIGSGNAEEMFFKILLLTKCFYGNKVNFICDCIVLVSQ